MFVFVCGFVHLSAVAPKGQKRASETLGLELQVIVSHLIQVLQAALGYQEVGRSLKQ